ncbi:MAG TPA: cellulose biosynthesis protein BcsD [Stellaceae bacterium]|nr:cellulose biosynthesis protein BcsD [Stellaceae bacterium]
MASPALDEEMLSLHYYARQQCSRQWVHFMAAMFSEFEERGTSTEADQFLETIGAKMARLLPLRRCESLEELQEDINSVLEGIDWGWMRLREADAFIEITHGAYPLVPQNEHRGSWMIPVLQGLYGGWLGEQGGDPSLLARLHGKPAGNGAALTFRYGRHD